MGPDGGAGRGLGAARRHRPRQHRPHRWWAPSASLAAAAYAALGAGRRPSRRSRCSSPASGSRRISTSTSARRRIHRSTRPAPSTLRCAARGDPPGPVSAAHAARRSHRAARPRQPGPDAGLHGHPVLATTSQYFTWQWARSLADGLAPGPVTIALPDAWACAGSWAQRRVRPSGVVAAARALPGHRARAGGLHELQAGVRPGSTTTRGGRPRGPGAGLLLRGELHRVGTLGRDRAAALAGRRLSSGAARLRRLAPALLHGRGGSRWRSTGASRLAPPRPRCHVWRPTSPTTC